MIILTWNVRGLGSSCKHREVRNIVRRYKCDFLILCKTKLDSFSLPLLRSIGGGRLNQSEFLPSQGAAGGILIDWDAAFSSKFDIHLGNVLLSLKFKNYANCFELWLT